jgi:hypothetical protein
MRSGFQKIKDAVLEALEEHDAKPRPFNCNHCPCNADKERGPACPAWGSIMLDESSNGKTETKVIEACYFARMEKWHEGIRGLAGINIESLNAVRTEQKNAKDHTTECVAALLINVAENFQALRPPASDRRLVNDNNEDAERRLSDQSGAARVTE